MCAFNALFIPILFCAIFYFASYHVNQHAAQERDVANCLVVLSGILAALAILIPLDAGLIQDSRKFAWAERFMAGSMISGAACLFGIVYCMISLQDVKRFKPQDKLYVPGWINATWIALGMLSAAAILIKLSPLTSRGPEPRGAASSIDGPQEVGSHAVE